MALQNNPMGAPSVAGGDIALALMADRGESDPSLFVLRRGLPKIRGHGHVSHTPLLRPPCLPSHRSIPLLPLPTSEQRAFRTSH